MLIRQGHFEDSESIASCLFFAMEEIVYAFIGERDHSKGLAFMRYFTDRENNQYSWNNCWVAESQGRIVAAVNLYEGARLHELRQPVLDYLKLTFNCEISPEDETQPGEIYIDSLGVDPHYRGNGIASSLLRHLIDEYVAQRDQTLGLLVDKENPAALRLYIKLGFTRVGTKSLLGKSLEHFQITRTRYISPSEFQK